LPEDGTFKAYWRTSQSLQRSLVQGFRKSSFDESIRKAIASEVRLVNDTNELLNTLNRYFTNGRDILNQIVIIEDILRELKLVYPELFKLSEVAIKEIFIHIVVDRKLKEFAFEKAVVLSIPEITAETSGVLLTRKECLKICADKLSADYRKCSADAILDLLDCSAKQFKDLSDCFKGPILRIATCIVAANLAAISCGGRAATKELECEVKAERDNLSCIRGCPEPLKLFRDADGDGFGAGNAVDRDEPGGGYVETGGDCDDNNPAIHPGAPEPCGIDLSCDRKSLPCPPTNLIAQSQCDGQWVSLRWRIDQNLDIEKFVIESSADAINWTKVDSVLPASNVVGGTNFSFKTLSVNKRINFYRVVAYDEFGSKTYSYLLESPCALNISISPNPIRNRLTLTIPSTKGNSIKVRIYNSYGTLVYSKETGLVLGVNNVGIDMTTLRAGHYMAIVSFGSHTKSLKLVKAD
jgi:hypothetical protein